MADLGLKQGKYKIIFEIPTVLELPLSNWEGVYFLHYNIVVIYYNLLNKIKNYESIEILNN